MLLASHSLTDPGWNSFFGEKVLDATGREIDAHLQMRLSEGARIYPPHASVFSAFELTPLANVKVVILGQDPYHGEGQAMGLSFSVPEHVKIPPSLKNIYKEISSDIGGTVQQNGDLSAWARQGVLLLNAILTVEDAKPGAHAKIGWERLTDQIIQHISDVKQFVVFMLWGAFAGSKRPLIDERKHLVLAASHPSPLSAYRGFFGCRHFSAANDYLAEHAKSPIIW